MSRLNIKGYGQIELNQVAFRRDGRIEAQCKMAEGIEYLENGMLLAVDNVKREVKFATDDSFPIALNYTTEHMYDERANALKDFKLENGSFLPRLGYLAVGDKFTTNCVSYEEWDNDEALKEALKREALETTPVYGGACEDGSIMVSTTKPSFGPVLVAVAGTTMPDGQFGIKFQALKA